jgi:hypothetical protein
MRQALPGQRSPGDLHPVVVPTFSRFIDRSSQASYGLRCDVSQWSCGRYLTAITSMTGLLPNSVDTEPAALATCRFRQPAHPVGGLLPWAVTRTVAGSLVRAAPSWPPWPARTVAGSCCWLGFNPHESSRFSSERSGRRLRRVAWLLSSIPLPYPVGPLNQAWPGCGRTAVNK